MKPTLKTRLKISKALKGKKFSLQHRFNLSKSHRGKMLREKHPNWKGGIKKVCEKYITVYSPNHPYRDKHNHVPEHRLVMEKKLGRYLKPEELVHHINGIVADNRIENLKIVDSLEHSNIHTRKHYFCTVKNCDKKHVSLGLCGRHYYQFKKLEKIISKFNPLS